ncbi:APC family permease [Halostagnicola kamekurae]|uniref:L-asparagine transporter n=1 Tax=Halostagnicola kamekurae TaxID=619731 RepID=A0A1I6TVT6_9EURY|nr:APC family permease [Halostagnicola kamekurae]SFS93280.1 L-asparagine transporter [Halostagnicola kamekurae]
MTDGNFGLTESVSMALGGMIGGGIYAVFGVVTGITQAATWFAFLLAGLLAICSAYSYNWLNELVVEDGDGDGGGSVTFVQSFTGNSTLAGMIGWTLLFGYVGSMAMYAFAFAEFTISLPGVPSTLGGIPVRPIVSVLVVGGFVGLNLLGARATGSAENVLTSAKVLVLVVFGLAGLVYALSVSSDPVTVGTSRLASFSPVMAAAVSFVAFQGWQLLFYDQESIADPLETIPKAIYLSIPVAVAIYVLVALVAYNLAPEAIQNSPHTALVDAASTIGSAVGLATAAGVVISLSALFSTASAINATMFSAGYFAKGMLTDDLLPDRAGDSSASGVPTRTLLILGLVTAVFTAYGSLSAITSFASLSFIVVFGSMSALAFTQRDSDRMTAIWPAVGTVGGGLSFVLMFYHLYSAERGTFYAVILITVAVLAVELLYFEREILKEEIPYAGRDSKTAGD